MENLIEFALTFTLFGSAIVFWLVTVALVISLFTSEIIEDGFVGFFSIGAFLIVMYIWGNVSINLPTISIWDVAIYIGLGLIYSIIRTYFFGKKEYKLMTKGMAYVKAIEDNNESHKGLIEKNTKERTLNELKGHVLRWWALFPISLFLWMVSDLANDLFDIVYGKMSKGFNYILTLGFK